MAECHIPKLYPFPGWHKEEHMSIKLEILPPTSRRLRLSVPRKMRHWVCWYAQGAAELLHVTTGQWIVHLVEDQRMIQYHQRTMNLATTTDVLTFNYTDTDRKDAPLDLETIICVDEAERQASIRPHRRAELEILLYCIHSLLHCIGYDDRSIRRAGIMHRKEDFILQQMGLPAVYYIRSGTQPPQRLYRITDTAIEKNGPLPGAGAEAGGMVRTKTLPCRSHGVRR